MRRRIIMLLMLSGNVGIVTVVASLVLTLGDIVGPGPWLPQLVLLAAGIGLLTLIATSRWVEHRLSSLIAWALRRWTTIDVHDYANLLHLCGEYGVVETPVGQGRWLANTTLGTLSLGEEGVLVLGVQRRDGSYVGAPTPETRIIPGDVLTLYGRTPRRGRHGQGGFDHMSLADVGRWTLDFGLLTGSAQAYATKRP